MPETPRQPRELRRVSATRYVTPLREGGSLPGLMEADDDGIYVVKFHAAGQGPKALVAEVIAGEIGRALDLSVPELVLVELDPALGRSERDYEVRSLIVGSAGLNLGMDFLPGALTYEPGASPRVDADLASRIVWFDAFVTNVDRTARNPNLLEWHRRLWLIDHGAALYFHHGASADYPSRAGAAFPRIADHVLLPYAERLAEADAALRPLLDRGALEAIVGLVPDEWLALPGAAPLPPETQRAAYVEYLVRRLDHSERFVEEAERARAQHV